MYSVYQGAVYQSYVYQREGGGSSPVVPPVVGAGWGEKNRAHFYDSFYTRKKIKDLIPEQAPEVVKQAIVDVVDIQDKKKREKKFRFELSGVDKQNFAIYLAYLERVYSDWLDEQLRIEMLKKQQYEDDEIILLLLMSEV